MLDAAGDLRARPVGEFQLVEDIAGDLGVPVRIEQAIGRAADTFGARRCQFLMAGLDAEGRGHRSEAGIEGHHLHFHAAFLLLVGEGLVHMRRAGAAFLQADLVVLVVGRAGPEADRFDGRGIGAIFPLHGDLGLFADNARLLLRAFDAGDAVIGPVMRDRRADIAAVEEIRPAERRTAALHRRITLSAVEGDAGLGIGVGRHIVVAGLVAIDIGMHGDIAAAGIEQDAAIDAARRRTDRGAHLCIHAARRGEAGSRCLGRQAIAHEGRGDGAIRQRVGNAVIGGGYHAADGL